MSHAEDLETNRLNWDDRVAGHIAEDGYNPQRFVHDPELLSQTILTDRDVLGDLSGKHVAHLQCHIGTDTISLARLGAASVTGVDFSPLALQAARDLANQCNETRIQYIESNVLEAADKLPEGSMDFVYASVGVIGWIPDLCQWMKVARALLKPDGKLILRDGHPAFLTLDENRDELVAVEPGFANTRTTWDESTSYDGSATLTQTKSVDWAHGVGDILTALLKAGFHLDSWDDLDFIQWQAIALLEKHEDGLYRLPEKLRTIVPLEFRLTATVNK